MLEYDDFVNCMQDGYTLDFGDMYYTVSRGRVYVTTDIGFTTPTDTSLYALYCNYTSYVGNLCRLISCSRRYKS